MHYAKVNIPMELGVEVNIKCRSPQVGAEVRRLVPKSAGWCRSYSMPKLLVPNIDCPGMNGTNKEFAILGLSDAIFSSDSELG